MKDLEFLSNFLKIQARTWSNSIALAQSNYAYDLLNHADMLHYHPIDNPTSSKFVLTKADMEAYDNPTYYR